MSNPLLTVSDLPQFSQIKPEHIKPAVEHAIAECKKVIAAVLEEKTFTWANLVMPTDEADDTLSKLWSPVSHMNSVVNSDKLRDAYESCLPLLSEYSTFVGQHQGLYQAYQQFANSDEYSQLNIPQKKVIENALRDFKLSGIALNDNDKKRYGEIVTRLSELSSTFGNNVLDATHAYSVNITDKSELTGLPDSAIEAAAELAKEQEKQGWLFTLDIPSYLPVMTYCSNATLREQLYRGFVTRASDQGPNAGKFDNSDIMNELLLLRHELAQLLGFNNFAEKSIATKMASSTTEVLDFLENLAVKSKVQGQQDLDEVKAFAEKEFNQTDLQAWDLPYYSEKLKQSRYAISDEECRPYFPEEKVVAGLFEVVHRLFGMTINQVANIDTWHKDVKFYQVYDRDNNLRGRFYLDLYARAHKRGGAWMDDCKSRRELANGDIQYPVAYLTCNFNKPIGDKPALFTHDEVVTLFHEFGHGIHHMLTQINTSGVSGIDGVPWDAVELPSQFLENWCWQPEALAFISGHYQTGEPLPQAMLDKMLAAKNYQSAMQMLRQLEFSIFDFKMHKDYQPAQDNSGYIQQTLNQVREEYSVLKAADFNRFQHGFGHIFGGGYSAGYYSYKWAEVLSADAFSRFEEEGIFNPKVGNDFLTNILEKGGSQEPSVLFKAFRGREPEIDALLRHCGIEG
ncbi:MULTISPECIES: oligopeptidase A [unclassified Colwellia]|jgi:oligopeptidase A|uniref:oligopeptidase A n=1 Tax=unclassified Colwellia TaxID=196834 RepID=UPI0015F62C49|nr:MULTISPECIES: oligopeptidase A [unclassified Colwellia]MBA6336329.1 oligopeptidase A [Colwellia sp. BRX8-7]MBA6377839.1 oligopeptidase A [Colwellia sp. BRX10-7]MBA6387844.1 oligopeptidase A [Colwellia sp. BRX10-2]MBA6400847.1 oligopeptidase A [Colwellia sp. BRX10-5]MBA6404691.1 oligopeptidase A [Colwellia sp. BRX10-1]